MEEQIIHIMPCIGEAAPAFKASTTQGPIDFPADYAGKWIILFSHPSDFTPTCTSEFMTFGAMQKEFTALNCQLVGLSIDGLSSHIAWLREIRKIEWKGLKNIDVEFPLIDDITMNVAKIYGMIQPSASETKAVRAVFFIDPKGIIRAIIYYPQSLGRNFDELRRVLIALQTTDRHGVSTPADWHPGDPVIVPAPTTMAALHKRDAGEPGITCHAWWFCTRPLAKAETGYDGSDGGKK
ncbi:MAG: peroxiredoxin [Rikenellaceae bacterium]|nr:peroxiredoxin [Rikenellaceae bacterium]MCL2692907.1 peroxiredoxin [Rikenellaceae bacterium]